jgi:CheY-like chemotaxis protein
MIRQILLIDDNEIDNYITRQLLCKHNVADNITACQSATDALNLLSSTLANSKAFPEIIFLDISMPEMDGFGFLREYELFPESAKKNTSIIMLSSSQNPDDIAKAKKNPLVKEYLQKPITKEAVARLFNQRVAA